MSRTTDTERGAHIALETAVCALVQPDLFDAGLPPSFWHAIEMAAHDQLDEVMAYKAAFR
ncbi:hypothetical protein [Xanthomonas sp. XNM01]|uniref:hypothetical protein n=1 Tax=Xanthomonas sp. XNM01 TaxID=2769289 RepID=UPI00177E90FE|nr:hypothetical protein [Xanthomonas sp. XNM01]MBD9368388.1 hypothetical protein [Xanthomonas sp. XNM01]